MADSSEDTGEKNQQPTERQRQKSQQAGQVARSRDMMTAFHCLLLFLFLGMSESWLLAGAKIFRGYDQLLSSAAVNSQWLTKEVKGSLSMFPGVFLPMALVVIISCVVGAITSGPLIFSFKAMGFKLQRINPVTGIKKVFSIRGLAEVIKALLKSLLLGLTLYLLLSVHFGQIMTIGSLTMYEAARQSLNILYSAGVWLSLVLLMMAVPDVIWQKYRFSKDQMLTRQQARESHKNEEGAPESRQRLRRVQRQQASAERKKMLESVPDADLIVTNPEHYAVALQYFLDKNPEKNPEKNPKRNNTAPVVIAKGVDFLAELITKKAHQAHKPVLIQPMLTRALYYHTHVGQEIPPDLYSAVAQVMVYLYQLDQYRREQTSQRPRPPVITVPEKYEYLASSQP